MHRPRILALIVVCAAALCVICLRQAESQSPLRRITNTTNEGISINPSISGDGRILAFESTEDIAGAGGSDHFRAIRANISVDPPTFFQMGGTRTVAPAISQDGSRIAFASKDNPLGTNSDGNSEIFLFNGSSLLQVTNTSPGDIANRVVNGNFQPSISDDGRYLAFSSNRDIVSQNADGNLEVFVFDSTANSLAQLTNSAGTVGASDAKISGNGAKVAFIRDTGSTPSARRDLMIQDRASGPAQLLASQVQSLLMTFGRAISDDGARVVYAGETATNASQVFFYDGRSANVNRQVTSLGARVTELPLHPTISGDGKRLAFATRRALTGFANSDSSIELYTYDIPTNTFGRVTSATGECDCFDGGSLACEVVSSMNDDGSTVAFNFPRALSGAVAAGLENKSEIYATGVVGRPPFGSLTVLNHASFGHEPNPIKAVAPDSIAVALGTVLANTTQQSQRLPGGGFPTNVAGTTVTVNGRAAQIFYVSPNQVQFLVPLQTELGTAEVVITNADGFASRGNVPIFRTAPGIFTKTGDGVGEGMILDSDTLQEGPFDPAGGNLRLLIFATGARNAVTTTVNIGGRIVNAESVVASPDMVGLDEVRVRVPTDLRGTGTVNLTIQSDSLVSNTVTVRFTGDPSRAVFINEVLADPPDGISGDANRDGTRDGTQDEFVELVNGTSNEVINMSGWTLRTRATGSSTETTRFTFASGTSLPPGQAIVVFGGGNANFNPNDNAFGCAQVVRATTSAGLSLTNGGLTIHVRDAAGNEITQFIYGGSSGLEGDNNQSLTRSPDITGPFVQHTTAGGANPRRYSPGLKIDGTPFGNCPSILTSVTISPPSATINVGQTQQFTAQAFDQFGRVMTGVTINFTSDNTSVATVGSVSMNSTTGVATTTVTSHNPGTAHITASATDGATTVNSSQATLTVNGPSLTINDVSQNEGDTGTTTFTFTVSLSTPAPAPVTFNIATQDNTATVADNDYVARSLTAQTIAAGQQTYTFDVTVNGDTNIESNETFFVNVTNVSGASVTDNQGLGTILSDDSPVLNINDVSIAEGNSGTATFTFTITSTRPAPAGGITFDIATADGTAQDDNPATEDNDYVASSTTGKTITVGNMSTTFDVIVNGDTAVEADETFNVTLSNATNAVIGDGVGVGTIQNDDSASLVISQIYPGGGLTGATFANDFVELYNRGNATIDFSITPYSVQFLSTSGSSWAKTDLTSGTIPPGRYFLVREASGGGTGAALPAADATGTINLTSTTAGKVALLTGTTLLTGNCPGDDGSTPFNPLNGTISDFVGYLGTASTANHCYEGTGPAPFTSGNNTIADFRKSGGCVDTNDNAADFVTATPNPRNTASPFNDCSTGFRPDITINDVATTEGDSGTKLLEFTVTLSAANATQIVTVNYATADGSASSSSDYQSSSGVVTFNPGETSKPVSVTINGDTTLESNETFFVNLTNPTNASILDPQGQGTIQEDDVPPTLSINDISINEGNSSTTTFQFTVSLSAPALAGGVTFNIATQDDTATVADSDYVTRSLTGQTIPAGQQTYTFDVDVNGDTSQEANENFLVNVTTVSGATVADGQGTGTIQDDDAPPTLSILDVTQAETNSSTTTFNFTVQLSSSAQVGGVSFTINTADGTTDPATAGNDYAAIVNGSGSIAQGNTSTTVSVTVNGDAVFEPDETFFVNISAVSGATVTDGQALGTITNDDAQPTITIADASLLEGNAGTSSMTFIVTLTGASQSSITVNYATADSSATLADSDYATATGMLTFVPGDTSESFSVTINGDTNAEGDEMFLVNLSGASGATIADNLALGIIFLDDPFSIAAVNTAYSEDFNVLAPSDTSATTPTAWTRAESGTTANLIYTANSGSSNTGDTYSYGTGTSTERALGGLQTGTLVPILGAFYRNDTGSTLNTLQVSYTGEQWRLGSASRTDQLDFQYSTSATSLTTGTWIDVNALDFTTPNTTTTGAKDGNDVANRTAITNTITGLSIAPGATFWIRWTDFNASGADDGLAVDDFSITAGVDTPALSILDKTQIETNGSTTTFNFTVQLTSPAPPGGVSFTINTADGSTNPANAGSDYVAIVNGSGSIAQNGTSTTVAVTVNGDTDIETDETFFVNLSGVIGATVTDGQGLGTITNDDAAAGSADLSITKADTADPVAIGNDITYNITVTNGGPTVANNVELTDTVPTNTTFRSIAPPLGWTCPTQPGVGLTGPISCTNASFGVGSAVFTLVVRVGSAVADGTIITNTASVSSSTTESNPGNETAMQTTTVKQPLLVISQVYGGGGNASATYTNDFIEIFNRGTTTVDFSITPYSVQYAAATSNFSTNKTDITSGTLQPGRYFLIQQASGGAAGVALPTPDATGSIAMSATAGKVALVLGTTSLTGSGCPLGATIVDFLGYGTTANCSETAPIAMSGTNSNGRSAIRTASCTDTNNNSSDFSNPTTAPVARNTATTPVICP